MVEVVWIPNLGAARKGEGKRWAEGLKWGGDFMLEGVARHIDPKYRITPRYDFEFTDFKGVDIVYVNNVASSALRRELFFFRTSRIVEYVKLRDRPRFCGGVRGVPGLNRSRGFLRYFDAVPVGSEYLAERVRAYNPRVYVCNDGLDTEAFKPEPEPDEFSIGWAGDTAKKVKNFDLLPRLGFPLKTATKESYIPFQEMPRFYAGISVYVNVSSTEGFCRPLVEAAACGRPVVSTDVGVASELLQPEWVVEGDPREAQPQAEIRGKIQTLKDDAELRRRAGAWNRESSLRWDWRSVVKQFEKMFEDVLSD